METACVSRLMIDRLRVSDLGAIFSMSYDLHARDVSTYLVELISQNGDIV